MHGPTRETTAGRVYNDLRNRRFRCLLRMARKATPMPPEPDPVYKTHEKRPSAVCLGPLTW
jgi:hypothetical protein